MKLTVHDDLFTQIGTDGLNYDPATYPDGTSFKFEPTVGSGRTELSDPTDWIKYAVFTGSTFTVFRNHTIDTFIGSWGSSTDPNKKALITLFVYPASTPVAELDALYTQAERDVFRDKVKDTLAKENTSIITPETKTDVTTSSISDWIRLGKGTTLVSDSTETTVLADQVFNDGEVPLYCPIMKDPPDSSFGEQHHSFRETYNAPGADFTDFSYVKKDPDGKVDFRIHYQKGTGGQATRNFDWKVFKIID